MIVSFKGKFAEAIMRGESPKGFPSNLRAGANRRLQAVHNAVELHDLRSPPGNRLEALSGIAKVGTPSGSTTSGASASAGPSKAPRTWRSLTITDRVPN